MVHINSLYLLVAYIKNGLLANRKIIYIQKSKFVLIILNLLMQEGFIVGFGVSNKSKYNMSSFIYILLKYNNGVSVITQIKTISKPGCRLYSSVKSLWKKKDVYSVYVVSTSKGVMTDKIARMRNLGGEVLIKIC